MIAITVQTTRASSVRAIINVGGAARCAYVGPGTRISAIGAFRQHPQRSVGDLGQLLEALLELADVGKSDYLSRGGSAASRPLGVARVARPRAAAPTCPHRLGRRPPPSGAPGP